jgi:hypothetical protein
LPFRAHFRRTDNVITHAWSGDRAHRICVKAIGTCFFVPLLCFDLLGSACIVRLSIECF